MLILMLLLMLMLMLVKKKQQVRERTLVLAGCSQCVSAKSARVVSMAKPSCRLLAAQSATHSFIVGLKSRNNNN